MAKSNDFIVLYVDTHGDWQQFYRYGDDFHAAITDARGTLGIDLWAILNHSQIVAFSKDAPLGGVFGAALNAQLSTVVFQAQAH